MTDVSTAAFRLHVDAASDKCRILHSNEMLASGVLCIWWICARILARVHCLLVSLVYLFARLSVGSFVDVELLVCLQGRHNLAAVQIHHHSQDGIHVSHPRPR